MEQKKLIKLVLFSLFILLFFVFIYLKNNTKDYFIRNFPPLSGAIDTFYNIAVTPLKPLQSPIEKFDPGLPLPEIFIYNSKYLAPVRNQGRCGACWAFAVSQQLESDGIRLGLYDLDVSLSPQQIISCDTEAVGCSGGWTESAYNYVAEACLIYESQYPFTAYMEKEMTEDSAECTSNAIKGNG